MPSRMLKSPPASGARLSCSSGLSGLSGLFGSFGPTNKINQTDETDQTDRILLLLRTSITVLTLASRIPNRSAAVARHTQWTSGPFRPTRGIRSSLSRYNGTQFQVRERRHVP